MSLPRVFVAIGGNVGDVAQNLARAVRMINTLDETAVMAVSSLYRTAPVGGPAQPDFFNGVVAVQTGLAPHRFMRALLEIENELGRVRTVADGPRTVDLDLVLWENLVLDTPELTLPHPRMHLRAFVLAPLAQIAPDAAHPILKKTVAELLGDLGPLEGVERVPTPFDPLGQKSGAAR